MNAVAMDNMTLSSLTPRSDDVTSNDGAMELGMVLLLLCVTLLSIVAVPPNLLLLHLALRREGGKRNSLAVPWPVRDGDLPLFLISQSVSHVLICLTSPLDVLFLLQVDSGNTLCLTFLSVKSVLILFSVLVVGLQGVDKVYRVRNLHRPFMHSRVRLWVKTAAIALSGFLSCLPLLLELALSGGQQEEEHGCHVLHDIVDLAVSTFFLSCVVSIVSLVAVVVMLRAKTRRVTVEDREETRAEMTSRACLTSARIPSLSEQVDMTVPGPALETGSGLTEVTTASADEKTPGTRKRPCLATVMAGASNSNEDNCFRLLESLASLETRSAQIQSSSEQRGELGGQPKLLSLAERESPLSLSSRAIPTTETTNSPAPAAQSPGGAPQLDVDKHSSTRAKVQLGQYYGEILHTTMSVDSGKVPGTSKSTDSGTMPWTSMSVDSSKILHTTMSVDSGKVPVTSKSTDSDTMPGTSMSVGSGKILQTTMCADSGKVPGISKSTDSGKLPRTSMSVDSGKVLQTTLCADSDCIQPGPLTDASGQGGGKSSVRWVLSEQRSPTVQERAEELGTEDDTLPVCSCCFSGGVGTNRSR